MWAIQQGAQGRPRCISQVPQNLSTGAFPTATFAQNFLAVPTMPGQNSFSKSCIKV